MFSKGQCSLVVLAQHIGLHASIKARVGPILSVKNEILCIARYASSVSSSDPQCQDPVPDEHEIESSAACEEGTSELIVESGIDREVLSHTHLD